MISAADIVKQITQPAAAAGPVSDTPPTRKDIPFVPFYDIKYAAANQGEKAEIRTIKVNFAKLVEVLKSMGFRRLDVQRQSFIVRIKDNVVIEVSQKEVIDTFVAWLESFGVNLPDGVMVEPLISKLYGGIGTFFSDNILYRLINDKKIVFNEHTRSEAFFYYQNGYVKVTEHGATLKPYNTLPHYIWANQILRRNYNSADDKAINTHPWARFTANVANAWAKHPNTEKEQKPDNARLAAFQTLIGYTLHSYYEGKLRAVIFTDARMSEDAAGRSGKTLFCKALGHILNAEKHSSTYVELNGKDFDPHEKFKYQELAIDTRLVHLNDVARNFEFEALFNDITEGIRAQRKNEAPFPVMAKLILSTNRTIRIHGDSAKDRSIEFEFADYYGANWSPEREFKQWFFRDWNAQDWACFDNYLLRCVAAYLKKGLIQSGAINLVLRKMYEETAPEFIRWMEERQFVSGQEYAKADLHAQFIQDTPDFKMLKQKTFTKWARTFGDSHPDFSGCEERRSSGKDLIKFTRKPEDISF